MQDTPRISVVMSVYNGEKYLEEAVRSILGQSFRDFEFLIVDDGSTDQTISILEKLGREDERIHFFRQENAGPAAAKILGFGRRGTMSR
ncbi:MAG: glycosyltransferase [Planctomycetales bacterium]